MGVEEWLGKGHGWLRLPHLRDGVTPNGRCCLYIALNLCHMGGNVSAKADAPLLIGVTPYPLAGSLRLPIASPHSLWEAEAAALLRQARRYGGPAALPDRMTMTTPAELAGSCAYKRDPWLLQAA
ncbi:hypothetical protein EV294_11460 [Paenibacillus sp. BK033]|nr:hypothetical protein EV294_11460 [Paenibacillus sp. BK033]